MFKNLNEVGQLALFWRPLNKRAKNIDLNGPRVEI